MERAGKPIVRSLLGKWRDDQVEILESVVMAKCGLEDEYQRLGMILGEIVCFRDYPDRGPW